MTEPRPPSSPRRRVALRWLLLGGALLLSGAALVVLAWTAPDAPPPATLPAPAASAAPTRCQDDPQAVRVELSPVGAVCFAQAPLRAVTLDATYNDILTALDQEERLIATGFEGNHFEGFYAQLPDLSVGVDFARLPAIGAGLDKETLYGLRADVHHIDPERLVLGGRWTRQDVAEIAQNVAPFFANRYSRERSYPGDQPYAYYTTWELHAKLARVYRRAETADALEAIWQQLLRDITARLPPEAERPRVGLIIPNRGRFTPFSLGREGYGTAHYRAVGARDAFASIQALTYADAGRSASLDLEGLAALDPDVIIMPFAIYPPYHDRYQGLVNLKNDPLGARLQAVKNGRVYPGGSPLQGPLFLLFQTEMTAKQLYPDRFGPFRPDHRYPPEEQLFDRAAVARALQVGGAPP